MVKRVIKFQLDTFILVVPCFCTSSTNVRNMSLNLLAGVCSLCNPLTNQAVDLERNLGFLNFIILTQKIMCWLMFINRTIVVRGSMDKSGLYF